MNTPRSIVVTGIGAVCAGGHDAPSLWERAVLGRPSPTRDPDGTVVCRTGDPRLPLSDRLSLARADRVMQLACVAAGEAFEDAGLVDGGPDPARLGVFVGTSRGPISTYGAMFDEERPRPTRLVNGTLASASGALSVLFECRGPSATISATCASGAHAIALGAAQILAGATDVMLVGGADTPLAPALLRQYEAAGILGTHDDPARVCRPFDATRNGTVFGEGAGFLVLESAEHAQRRGAQARARLAGWSLTSDASSRSDPDEQGEGIARAVRDAISMAGLAPRDIGYVNAHGSGTPHNDVREARGVASVLGEGSPCGSTKPISGHCAGATPAIEAVLGVLAIEHETIPPTATCEQPDPACPVDPIPLRARDARLDAVLSNAVGFWGTNASLVLAKP